MTLGCATNEMNRLKTDISELQRRSHEINDSLSTLRRMQAESGAKIDGLQAEFHVLTGRFEELRYYMERNLKEAKATKEGPVLQIKEIEGRLKGLEERLFSIESRIQPTPPEEPKEPPKGPEQTEGDAYKEAYNAFREGRIGEAKEAFKGFLKAYPEGEYSDNAQYWLGESYFAEKDYENAILTFEDLIKKYPKSDKVPGAILKQGYAFYELGDNSTGKLLMERVIERFPKSEEAPLAKKRLKEEKEKSHSKKNG